MSNAKYEGDPYQVEMESAMKGLLSIVTDKDADLKARIAAASTMDDISFHTLQAYVIREVSGDKVEKVEALTEQVKKLRTDRKQPWEDEDEE